MKHEHESTTVRLPADVSLKEIVTAMLGTPPPPAGDPATRKKVPATRKKKPTSKR